MNYSRHLISCKEYLEAFLYLSIFEDIDFFPKIKLFFVVKYFFFSENIALALFFNFMFFNFTFGKHKTVFWDIGILDSRKKITQ